MKVAHSPGTSSANQRRGPALPTWQLSLKEILPLSEDRGAARPFRRSPTAVSLEALTVLKWQCGSPGHASDGGKVIELPDPGPVRRSCASVQACTDSLGPFSPRGGSLIHSKGLSARRAVAPPKSPPVPVEQSKNTGPKRPENTVASIHGTIVLTSQARAKSLCLLGTPRTSCSR
jgi:hypothetical protein